VGPGKVLSSRAEGEGPAFAWPCRLHRTMMHRSRWVGCRVLDTGWPCIAGNAWNLFRAGARVTFFGAKKVTKETLKSNSNLPTEKWPGFFYETSLSRRKTAHILCAARWVSDCGDGAAMSDVRCNESIQGFRSPGKRSLPGETAGPSRGVSRLLRLRHWFILGDYGLIMTTAAPPYQ
jgi:hypothetical protein